MNMVPKTHYTHVYRASAGFSLLNGLALLFSTVILTLVLVLGYPRPTDIISKAIDPQFQQEVIIHHLAPSGMEVSVIMTQYGIQTVMDHIWVDCYKRQTSIDTLDTGYKKQGRALMIQATDEVSTGQKVGLWYIFSNKKLRNGKEFEEVDRIEVRPLANSSVFDIKHQ